MVENVELQREIGDCENGCDASQLLLKKNFSWTHLTNSNQINSLAPTKSFRSKSNPHVVLDGGSRSNLRIKLPSLQHLISNRFSSNNNNSASHNNGRVKTCNKLAPLAKAISFTSMTTTNQTLATPTAIQLNAHQQQRRTMFRFNNFILHCKVIRQSLSLSYSLTTTAAAQCSQKCILIMM